MSNRTRRKLEQAKDAAQEAATQPHTLLAVVRRSRAGQTAVIEVIEKDTLTGELVGTCSAPDMGEALQKALDLMVAEMHSVTQVRLVVDGRK